MPCQNNASQAYPPFGAPFWDFCRAFDPSRMPGHGVDGFDGPASAFAGATVPDPPEEVPEEGCGRGRQGCHGKGPGRGAGCGRGRCRPRGGPFPAAAGPMGDMPAFLGGIINSPFFQGLGDEARRRAGGRPSDGDDAFTPPVDIFDSPQAYVVHVALPGAAREDIGVSWNPDQGTLDLAGVVHRPGDEQFLQTLSSGERRVGLFDRSIPLPPAGAAAKDEVDGSSITAKLENGLLVVVVPKMEKEWTEIRKVDIE